MPFKTPLTPAQGLNGVLTIRPIQALLELSRATGLLRDPAVSALTRGWSVLRYLGVFGRVPASGHLCLDGEALLFIGANQRRVLSEEIGIGFGIVAAKMWVRARNPQVGPIAAIDVDQALYDEVVPALERNGRRQPDYLLAFPDESDPSVRNFELLETKGTVSSSNAEHQLARGTTQLAGLTVDANLLPGVVVSTVSNAAGIRLMAVDPEERKVRWSPSDDSLRSARHASRRRSRPTDKIDVAADELFASSTNVEMASLAEFGGLSESARLWRPHLLDWRGRRADSATVRENDLGAFIGEEMVLEAPGLERIRVFQGVARDVATALKGDDYRAVAETQRQFARIEKERGDAGGEDFRAGQPVAEAVSSDGALLRITVQ